MVQNYKIDMQAMINNALTLVAHALPRVTIFYLEKNTVFILVKHDGNAW